MRKAESLLPPPASAQRCREGDSELTAVQTGLLLPIPIEEPGSFHTPEPGVPEGDPNVPHCVNSELRSQEPAVAT